MAVKTICGVILVSNDPAGLARFYAEALGLEFEREDHAGLEIHYGVDIGEVHFGIHPPRNMARDAVGNASATVAFNVDDLEAAIARLQALGARQLQPLRDEGFGRTTTFLDPDGNQLEIVSLRYSFGREG